MNSASESLVKVFIDVKEESVSTILQESFHVFKYGVLR